jgi:hypothetical protein
MPGSPYTECPPGEACTFTARGPRVRFAFNNLVEGAEGGEGDDDTASDDGGASTIFNPNLTRVYVASVSSMLAIVLCIIFMHK